ncbi:MAG TPA: hypothetical protein VHB74_14900 [Devosia sp.]|nr:hypothetical protein [Devosia sp.]
MTPERFAELAETYGAEPRRWPEAVRAAALAFMEGRPEEAEAALAPARRLDAALDSYAVPVPDARLARAIAATAPPSRATTQRIRFRQGVRLLALGLAGALSGALAIWVLIPPSMPVDDDHAAYAQTAFSDIAETTDE